MSKFVVDLKKQDGEVVSPEKNVPQFGDYQKPPEPGIFLKVLKIFGVVLLAALVAGGVAGFFYWRHLKQTPQYSLALLVDAARRDDQKTIDALVDTDAIVDDFVPQITDKAIELYGRGVAPSTIEKLSQLVAPLLPALKERAKNELPALIRDKTRKFDNVPFWAVAIGAEKYLTITRDGDTARIESKAPNKPLNLLLKRNGDRWRVVAVRDENLSRRIAEKIGQELIGVVKKNGLKKVGEQLGISNLEDILTDPGEIFK